MAKKHKHKPYRSFHLKKLTRAEIIKLLSPPKTAKDWRRWLKEGEKSKLSPLERIANTFG